MTMAERIDALRNVGVEVSPETEWIGTVGTPERRQVDIPDTVRAVGLNYSAEEWMALARDEGGFYLGGCCGNLSHVQDLMEGAFRFGGGGLENSELLEMGELLKSHGGFDEFEPMDDERFAQVIYQWGHLNPWQKLGVIFNAVEPALKPRNQKPFRVSEEADETKVALRTLDYEVQMLHWSDLFEVREEDVGHHEALRLLRMARLVTPTKTLLRLLEEHSQAFEGVALVDRGTGAVLENAHGQCIYGSTEEADRIIEITQRVQPNFAETVKVIPVTITVADGMVLHP